MMTDSRILVLTSKIMVASLGMGYGCNTQYIQFTITYYKILNQFKI